MNTREYCNLVSLGLQVAETTDLSEKHDDETIKEMEIQYRVIAQMVRSNVTLNPAYWFQLMNNPREYKLFIARVELFLATLFANEKT